MANHPEPPSYRLENGCISIEVIPALGAKIVSLRNLVTGREWMWRPRLGAPLFRNQPEDAFESSTLIGADECLPTIAPCRFQGRDLPDHGEVWSAPWTLDEAALPSRIQTSIRLPKSPLELWRSISIHENEISFDYRVTSLSNQPEKFLWAFHPLMPVEDGDCIELPTQITSVRIGAVKSIEGPSGSLWNWPEPAPGIRIDRIGCGSHANAYLKMFAEFSADMPGFAVIRRGRERLLFRFDPIRIPAVGLWYTCGGWNGHTHMAIEPTNAATDSLCAAAPGSRTVIGPFQTLEWQFRMVMETFRQ